MVAAYAGKLRQKQTKTTREVIQVNCMEQQIVDRAARLELALIADGRANIVRSLGERIGRLAADDWPKDYEVSLVRIHGEQISSTDSRFCAGDRIRKDMAICDVARNLREWAKKGRLITSVNVF